MLASAVIMIIISIIIMIIIIIMWAVSLVCYMARIVKFRKDKLESNGQTN